MEPSVLRHLPALRFLKLDTTFSMQPVSTGTFLQLLALPLISLDMADLKYASDDEEEGELEKEKDHEGAGRSPSINGDDHAVPGPYRLPLFAP